MPVALRVCATLAALAVPSAAAAQLAIDPGPLRLGPALDLDAGAGYESHDRTWAPFGRVGAGAAWLNADGFLGVTATAARTPLRSWAFGAQAEAVRIESGLGVSAGAFATSAGGLGAHAGVSLSLLHAEAQTYFAGDRAWAAVLYARVPVGLLFRVLKARAAGK